jgi:hypothetical protein
MNADSAPARQSRCDAMRRPAIPEQYDVGNVAEQEKLLQKSRPLIRCSAEIKGTGQPPEEAISGIEIDAID